MFKPTDTVGRTAVCIKTVSVSQRSFYQRNSDMQGKMRFLPWRRTCLIVDHKEFAPLLHCSGCCV